MRARPVLLFLALCMPGLWAPGCVTSSNARATSLARRVPQNHTGSFTIYWAEGIPKEKGEYRNGRRHGVIRRYHSGGGLAYEGRYEDGIPVGDFVHYDAGGAVAATETMEGGTRQGVAKTFYESGAPKTEVTFVDGLKQGAETQWFESGVVKLEGLHEGGEPAGRWRRYDEDGALRIEEYYFVHAGERVGRLETVFDREEQITAQRMQVRDGESWVGRLTMWHPNGIQAGLVEERDGMRDGIDVSWGSDALKRIEGHWRNDVREGDWTYWDETGAVVRRETYREGKPVDGG